MKENKKKGGTLEGGRRNKGVTNRVDASVLPNEGVCELKRAIRKKISDGGKRSRTVDDQVDLDNVSTKTDRRKKHDEVLRKEKKRKVQRIQQEEAQKNDDNMEDDIGGGTVDENERLEQNQTQKAVGRKKKDEALRKNKKKHKVQKTEPAEEQNCDASMEYAIGEGDVVANVKLEQKLRKAKKKKRRNVTGATEDKICKTETSQEAGTVEGLPTKGDQDLQLEKIEDEHDVYQIPSEDETSSQGMRKWIRDYYQSRPGLNALQEKIDEFVTAHEEQEEQMRIEKEEKAAEDGFTVVVHHKGRKKTTDAESGIAVGSASQAAILDKMATKGNKGVDLDFYRFQKREAKRNEIVMLRSKFEQDKKRMQELRAQRKFKPY